ncbi:M13 family metallopeptidase [Sphingomonas sp.]|jgi:putative endopeptidase|uniref:M13 family metallopeptidase n=1 Tax=Sphingomonas sp. TaxID=28214 RepID=UPI002D7F9B12|nr:M13-type metalloendopeptidase [Sphingomonas sp.]HEU0044697.1 M13-type metalloendopeptidase [Sphingomonas sp.]
MRKPVVAALLAATAVAAVHAQTRLTRPDTGEPFTRSVRAAPSTARPQIGAWGFDLAGMDRTIAPGDDFFGYAGGTWVRNTPVPADKGSYGAFDTLADLSRERTRGILEANRGSKIGQAYATYLDTSGIEAKGLAPAKPWLDKIKGLTSKAGYPALLAEASRNGVGTPFGGGVGQDAKNPEIYIVGVRQSGLGLPDRDYYLSADPKLVEARTAYQAHIAKMFTLAGEANADARAKALVDFETRIAQAHWTRVESRNADKTYNKLTVAQLQQAAPGFDFAAWLAAGRTPVTELVVAQPSAITGIAQAIAETPLDVLKDQLILRSLDGYADVLPATFDREQFAFYGTQLRGVPEQEARWKRAVSWTSGAVSDEVSKLYVAQYFPPETKAEADKLVRNVLDAMGTRIDKLSWMAPETKVRARAKLAAFTPKIGYPSRWRDYSNLTITPGDAFGNSVRAAQWRSDYNISRLGKPLQRWEWGMTPMTVNAYANFGMVEIVFPAAILQPPFFDPKADPAVNYGGIGAVIGHEISHHFDDQGAKFDAKGQLTQWWTDADVKNFTALGAKLIAQYDQYEPLPGQRVKGALTLGENIGDLAGLSVAYDAYKKSLGGRPAPVLNGMTGDQRFYLGWSQVWRRNYREAQLRQQLLTDPHSPSPQRAAVVRNMDPWYAAFQPKPGQKLYLAPEQRVRIW